MSLRKRFGFVERSVSLAPLPSDAADADANELPLSWCSSAGGRPLLSPPSTLLLYLDY